MESVHARLLREQAELQRLKAPPASRAGSSRMPDVRRIMQIATESRAAALLKDAVAARELVSGTSKTAEWMERDLATASATLQTATLHMEKLVAALLPYSREGRGMLGPEAEAVAGTARVVPPADEQE